MTPKQYNHPFALVLFPLLGALFVGHAIYHYSILPEQVATHFSLSGEPDAWGPKTVFFLLYGIVMALLAVMFGALNCALKPGRLSWLNIPDKQYWLAPERIHGTLNYVKSRMLLFGSGTLLFMIEFFHQAFQVSLGNASKLDHPLTSVALYLLFCFLWVFALYRRFGGNG